MVYTSRRDHKDQARTLLMRMEKSSAVYGRPNPPALTILIDRYGWLTPIHLRDGRSAEWNSTLGHIGLGGGAHRGVGGVLRDGDGGCGCDGALGRVLEIGGRHGCECLRVREIVSAIAVSKQLMGRMTYRCDGRGAACLVDVRGVGERNGRRRRRAVEVGLDDTARSRGTDVQRGRGRVGRRYQGTGAVWQNKRSRRVRLAALEGASAASEHLLCCRRG